MILAQQFATFIKIGYASSYICAFMNISAFSLSFLGVATFCRDAVTPVAAEEGLSSVLTAQPSIGCYGRSEERRVGKECRSRWSPYH